MLAVARLRSSPGLGGGVSLLIITQPAATGGASGGILTRFYNWPRMGRTSFTLLSPSALPELAELGKQVRGYFAEAQRGQSCYYCCLASAEC